MRIRTILNACLLLAVTCAPLSAQSVTRPGKFKGTVLDAKQKKVREASVTVEGKGYSAKLITNKAGEFEIALAPGVYQITVEKAGYKKYVLTEVAVEPGTKCAFTFRMEYLNPWVHEPTYKTEPIGNTNQPPV